MKIFRSANHSSLNSIITLAVGIFLLTACGIFSPPDNGSQNTSGVGWRVWIRTEPCAGRFDWLSVAKEKGGAGTGSGLASFVLYDTYLPTPGGFKSCALPEPDGCTFAEATALMEALRPHPRLSDFCCRDYSVWRNNSTGKMAVVLGKHSTGGFDFPFFVQGNLCCEEAEALAGIPGACSGSQAPPLGPVVRRTPGNSNTTTANGNTGGTDNNGGGEVVTTTPYPPQPPPPTPPVSGRWTLVSTTVTPDPPRQGDLKWSYNAQSSSAHLDVYNGDTADFQWTKPPTQIDENGFTISITAQCNSLPNGVNSALIGVDGDGLTSDTPAGERKVHADGKNGAPGSAQKSVTFKPSPNANELTVEIGLSWGEVRFIYKYQRAP